MEERETALEIVAAAQETKAEDLLLFDMERQSPITDFVLICSGRSQGHARGICDRIEARLKKLGVRPQSVEGYQEGSWILLDYHVVIVHIFHPETRRYYDLESLLDAFRSETFALQAPESGAADEGAASA
jgi:ribosome-associated protein